MSFHNVEHLLIDILRWCGTDKEAGQLFIEAVPNGRDFKVAVESRRNMSFRVSPEQQDLFLRQGFLIPRSEDMPIDAIKFMKHLEVRLQAPLKRNRHSNIGLRIRKLRDGQGQVIFLEPINRSFFVSPQSIHRLMPIISGD